MQTDPGASQHRNSTHRTTDPSYSYQTTRDTYHLVLLCEPPNCYTRRAGLLFRASDRRSALRVKYQYAAAPYAPVPEGMTVLLFTRLLMLSSCPVATRFPRLPPVSLLVDYVHRTTSVLHQTTPLVTMLAHGSTQGCGWPARFARSPSLRLGTLLALKRSKLFSVLQKRVAGQFAKQTASSLENRVGETVSTNKEPSKCFQPAVWSPSVHFRGWSYPGHVS